MRKIISAAVVEFRVHNPKKVEFRRSLLPQGVYNTYNGERAEFDNTCAVFLFSASEELMYLTTSRVQQDCGTSGHTVSERLGAGQTVYSHCEINLQIIAENLRNFHHNFQ